MTSFAPARSALSDTYVRDAYLYGYSADAAYRYLYETTLSQREPLNRLDYMAAVPDATYTAHPTINNDTLHIMGWLDVAAEPMIFHVPDHDEGRYWLLHVMDMDHYTLMAEGSRTRGTRGGVFMFASESWDGTVPEGVDEVFRSPSDILKVMPRIMVVSKPGDFETAKALQTKWRIEPLSAFAGTAAPAPVERVWPDPETTHWLERVNFILAQGTLAEADRHWIDASKDIGLAPGKADFTPEQLEAIARGEKLGMQQIIDRAPEMLDARSLLGTRAQLGTGDRLQFSEGTYLGQWGLPPEESMYFQARVDADGEPLSGAQGRRYRIHMPDPRVDCFWSWTVYNADDRLMAANPLKRHSRGDRTLVPDASGHYQIELAADCEGKADDPNFLPIPEKPFYMILRQYGPSQSTIDGAYEVPKVERTT